MALKTETREIGGMSVTVVQLPPRRSYKLLARLGRVLGPAFEKLDGVSFDSDVEALAPALAALFSQLDDEMVDDLMGRILQNATVVHEGKAQPMNLNTFDLVFAGQEILGFQVMVFALQVQYAEHFGGAVTDKAKAAMTAKLESLSASQTLTSSMSGQSGASG